MANAPAAAILAFLDQVSKTFIIIGPLKAFNENLGAGTTILAQANTYGDINLVNTIGKANLSATQQSYELTFNRVMLGQQFQQVGTWITQNTSVAASTLDAYLIASNAVTPFTYLVSPVTAFQAYLAPGGNPIPNSSGLAPTNNYMTPSNVFSPVVTFGSANITGTNTVTYTNNLNLPTSNNSIQIITVTGGAGTWTYTYKNVPSAAIAWNASASTAQTDINAVPTVGAGGVIVASPSAGVFIVQDIDAFSIANPNIATASVAGSGGATASLTNASSSTWVLVITAGGGIYTLEIGSTTEGIYGAAGINWNAIASTIQADLQSLLPLGLNVSVTGSAGTFFITLTRVLANQPFAYNFLQVLTGSLTGGSAKLSQTVIGGLQGYTGPAVTGALVTTTVNGTCVATVTANVVDIAGVFHAGRTFTVALGAAVQGTTVNLLTTGGGSAQAGDRILRITTCTVAGTATAGAWDFVSQLDRVIS